MSILVSTLKYRCPWKISSYVRPAYLTRCYITKPHPWKKERKKERQMMWGMNRAPGPQLKDSHCFQGLYASAQSLPTHSSTSHSRFCTPVFCSEEQFVFLLTTVLYDSNHCHLWLHRLLYVHLLLRPALGPVAVHLQVHLHPGLHVALSKQRSPITFRLSFGTFVITN